MKKRFATSLAVAGVLTLGVAGCGDQQALEENQQRLEQQALEQQRTPEQRLVLEQQQQRIAELERQVEQQEERIAELEEEQSALGGGVLGDRRDLGGGLFDGGVIGERDQQRLLEEQQRRIDELERQVEEQEPLSPE